MNAKRHASASPPPDPASQPRKKKTKGKRAPSLPKYLVARTNGTYEFHRKPKETRSIDFINELIGSDTVEMGQSCCSSYTIYMDGDGMMKQLPMNLMLNPFATTHWLLCTAKIGGPFGDGVIVCQGSVHSRKKLCGLIRQGLDNIFEDKDEMENYLSRLKKAMDAVE